MNDWLDYKGSGSARAYAANGLISDSKRATAKKLVREFDSDDAEFKKNV